MFKVEHIKKEILSLSIEEKILGISNLVLLISFLMPWYYGLEPTIGATGFVSDFDYINVYAFRDFSFFISLFVFLFCVLSLIIQSSKIFKYRLPRLGINYNNILAILGAESFFLILIVLLTYIKNSGGYPRAELKFGLFIAFLSAGVWTVISYYYLQVIKQEKTKKKRQEIFEKNYKENVRLEPEVHDNKYEETVVSNIVEKAVDETSEIKSEYNINSDYKTNIKE